MEVIFYTPVSPSLNEDFRQTNLTISAQQKKHTYQITCNQYSLIDTVVFSSYFRQAPSERDLPIWQAKEVFDKLELQKERKENSSQNAVDVPLSCKWASNDNQRDPASKEMAPRP
ncbi:hypothetical protein TNCV_1882451 [Trichonephila clavipes]|nr:hypothetical protein TNCV_1882451 [Trichonephila clavipes]